jgi:hypothetical protein
LYFAPFINGTMYAYDPATGEYEKFDTGLDHEQQSWDAWGASNGKIYFGTYPTCTFAEFDPKTGKTEVWPQVVPDRFYAQTFSEDEQGRILFLATHPETTYMRFDPVARTFEEVGPSPSDPKLGAPDHLPPPPAGDSEFKQFISVGSRQFAISHPTQRVWEIDAGGQAILRGETGWPAETWLLTEAPDAIIGISYNGALFRLDLKTDGFVTGELPNKATSGAFLAYAQTISPDCVAIDASINRGLALVNPSTGDIRQFHKRFDDYGVQGQCGVALNGKLYFGLYGGSILLVLDPDKPYQWNENPRELIDLHAHYNLTRPRDVVTDGQRYVYFSSDGGYSSLGGGLIIYDTQTDEIDVHFNLLEDLNMPSLAYDAKTRMLWGGTWIWGTSKSHKPRRDTAIVYAFDTASRTVLHELTIWPDAEETHTLAINDAGVLMVTDGASRMAFVDTATNDILYVGEAPVPPTTVLRRGTGHMHYCIHEEKLYAWDLSANTVQHVADVPECNVLTHVEGGTWIVAGGGGVYRLTLPDLSMP